MAAPPITHLNERSAVISSLLHITETFLRGQKAVWSLTPASDPFLHAMEKMWLKSNPYSKMHWSIKVFFFFFFFWPRGMRDLTSLTGVEPIRPALEGNILTSWQPGSSLNIPLLQYKMRFFRGLLSKYSLQYALTNILTNILPSNSKCYLESLLESFPHSTISMQNVLLTKSPVNG